MSYVVTYKVEGDIVIDDSVLSRLTTTPEEQARIKELEILDDETMTVAQLRELEALKKGAKEKTIDFNGVTITTKSLHDEEAALYVDLSRKTAFIPGHEGSNLDFKYSEEKNGLVISNPYFNDNYDNHLVLVQDVAEAFDAKIKIIYVSDEAGDDEEYGEVVYNTID